MIMLVRFSAIDEQMAIATLAHGGNFVDRDLKWKF
jgi:hypothetical protein